MAKIFTPRIIFRQGLLRFIYLLCLFVFVRFNLKSQSIKDSVAVVSGNFNPRETILKTDVDQLHFSKANHHFNFGLTGSEYHYILLKLLAPDPVPDHYLWIDNTSLDTISIYKIEKDTNLLLYRGGMLVEYNTGQIYVWHNIPLEISSVPSYYLIAVKASEKNINLSYEIGSRDRLQKKYEKYERFVFFYIGVASMIATIIFVAFLLFDKKVFAAYLGYIICISVWIVAHYGCIFPFVYPKLPVVNNVLKPVSSLASAVFLLSVLLNVFYKNLLSHPFFNSLIKGTKNLLLLLILLMPLFCIHNLNPVIKASLISVWHLGLLASVGMIVWTPLKFYYSGTLAKIFSSAMIVICITTLLQLFANTGLILNYFINEHGMAVGTLVQNSIMAFGLFYGLLVERKSKQAEVLALEEQQNHTLKKLIAVQDDERKRIAADLHDNIGPLLVALKINFRRMMNVKEEQQQIALLNKTEEIIDESILEIRNVAHNLMPKGLSSNGLINTLSNYFEDLQQVYNKRIEFTHEVQSIFEPELQMNIYRIISELVLNSAKHSNANVISVFIQAHRELVSILINDDGCGFEIKRNGKKKSLGIHSAESRVHYLKGTFHLETSAGKGTSIKIEIPL